MEEDQIFPYTHNLIELVRFLFFIDYFSMSNETNE